MVISDWLPPKNRSGEHQIWKTRAAGSLPDQAVQVTRKAGLYAVESLDGKSLYFNNGPEVWNIPVTGGAESRVFVGTNNAGFDVVDKGIYFIGRLVAAGTDWLQFYNFGTGEITPVVAIPRPPHMGISASADGRWILYTQIDHQGSNLMVVENFR